MVAILSISMKAAQRAPLKNILLFIYLDWLRG
jgi:hypothetical protein